MILISDGKETCDADPCSTAKELEKKGIDFVAHVIGFDVDKETGKQLKCIADATGGEYFSASNASALNAAMGSIVKKVEVKPKSPVVKLKKTQITATEVEGGKWVTASHEIYKVVDGERDSSYLTYCTSTKKKACQLQIPVGTYSVKTRYSNKTKWTPLELTAGASKLNILFGQFLISAKCSDQNQSISYEIYGGSGRIIFDKTAKCSEVIPAFIDSGSYTIESTVNAEMKETKFTVGGSNPNRITIDMRKLEVEDESHKDLIAADKKDSSMESMTEKKSETPHVNESTSAKVIKLSKDLEAFKKGILASLAPLKDVKACYQSAEDLNQAKECENSEEQAFKIAMDAMNSPEKASHLVKHSDWNEQIQKETIEKTVQDINKMELSIKCIDGGAGFYNLEQCIENDGSL